MEGHCDDSFGMACTFGSHSFLGALERAKRFSARAWILIVAGGCDEELSGEAGGAGKVD